jgi:hypothetical protein
MKLITILALTLAIAGGAFAQSFDFESTAIANHPGSFQVTSGGQVLTITPVGYPNGSISVTNEAVGTIVGIGVIANQGSYMQYDNFCPMKLAFANPLASITLRYGDIGGDSDSPVVVKAYDPTDNLLGTFTDTYPAGFAAGKSMTISLSNMSYFILSSGPDPDNADSLVWDVADSQTCNTEVPEPMAVVLTCMGLGSVSAYARRRRA